MNATDAQPTEKSRDQFDGRQCFGDPPIRPVDPGQVAIGPIPTVEYDRAAEPGFDRGQDIEAIHPELSTGDRPGRNPGSDASGTRLIRTGGPTYRHPLALGEPPSVADQLQ